MIAEFLFIFCNNQYNKGVLMKKFRLSALLIYAVLLGFSACGGGGGGASDDPQNPGGDTTISISGINGVTPPVTLPQ